MSLLILLDETEEACILLFFLLSPSLFNVAGVNGVGGVRVCSVRASAVGCDGRIGGLSTWAA